MKALLIYSGGLDSTTLLYEYMDSIALAVSFDYGSKHNAREIACAVKNCKRLGIRRLQGFHRRTAEGSPKDHRRVAERGFWRT